MSFVYKPFRTGGVYRSIELSHNKESTEFFYSLLGNIFQTKKYFTWPIEFIFQTFNGYLFPFHISHITFCVLEQQKYNSAAFESAECIILYQAPVLQRVDNSIQWINRCIADKMHSTFP